MQSVVASVAPADLPLSNPRACCCCRRQRTADRDPESISAPAPSSPTAGPRHIGPVPRSRRGPFCCSPSQAGQRQAWASPSAAPWRALRASWLWVLGQPPTRPDRGSMFPASATALARRKLFEW